MGLFVKRTNAGNAAPLYSLGMHKTILVVGLGNLGKEFDGTRHNIGFLAVDKLAKNLGANWQKKKDLKCSLAQLNIGDTRVLAIKPTTMMNLSGQAVQTVAQFYKIATKDILVVHDDLDIDWGQIRMRFGGSDAGHNGIKSVMQQCGEDFGRVRVGIGPKSPQQIDSADFVLSKFTISQQKQIDQLLNEVESVLHELIASGHISDETRKWLI
ncbi:MAG: aminoacyl-tRNA hydrolase [Patescibacteria group bacterium]